MANRRLYMATIKEFLEQDRPAVSDALHNNYHGEVLTTTDDAWMGEIDILQEVLTPWKEEATQIIFKYEIPRIGKCIDVVLPLRAIIFIPKGNSRLTPEGFQKPHSITRVL